MAQKKHLRHWEEKNKACLLNTMEPFSRPKTSKLRWTSYAISGFFLNRDKSGSLVQSGETCFIRETLIKQHSAVLRGQQCNRCGCKLKFESKLWKEKTSGLKVDVRRLICPPSPLQCSFNRGDGSAAQRDCPATEGNILSYCMRSEIQLHQFIDPRE